MALTGLPVYLAWVLVGELAAGSEEVAGAIPFFMAVSLLVAGIYQLSHAKRVCLQRCEAPLNFLMRRWRSGYTASMRLAASHAAFCIGCCWALMLILVVVGAMSLPWVLLISLLVFAEKLFPGGGRTAKGIGWLLIGASIAVAV